MNNQLQIFKNNEFGQVRGILINNEPYFVGKDVAEVLGYANSKDAIQKHVDDEDKQIIQRSQFTTLEIPNRGLTIINESGLYSLILSSKLPNAKKFKRWVTSEVLPQIRKTGSYNSNGIIKQLIEQLNNTNSRLQELESIVYKKQRQSIANRKHYLKLNEPLETRLDRITSDMINQIIANSIVDGILRRTEEGIVVDKNVLFFEASKFNIKKHDIKKKLELLNKIIYKQVRINGKNMWCIVVNNSSHN